MRRAFSKLPLAIALLMVVSSSGAGIVPPCGPAGPTSVGFTPEPHLIGIPEWEDGLDDLSRVYVPGGGLVGVVVADGEARLQPGEDEGWIASEIITCELEHKWDMLMVEVDTPGSSSVKLSVLNASADPSEVGFANETIEGYKLLSDTVVSLTSLSSKAYPRIRIQANLYADGGDRPRLLNWKVRMVDVETWWDDFDNDVKMSDLRNINISHSRAVLNLSSRAVGGGDYDPFPSVAFPRYAGMNVFYANAAGDGYDDKETLSTGATSGVDFDDVDGDGHLDMVAACYNGDSKVLWGDGTGAWSASSCTDIGTVDAYRVATGDLNGDGEVDLAFACYSQSGSPDALAFLNQGGRTFSNQADVRWTTEYTRGKVGDVNGASIDVVRGVTRPVWEPDAGTMALYHTAHEICQEIGFDLGHQSSGGGSDGNFSGALGIPTLDSIGVRGRGGHTLDEHIEIDSLTERAQLIAELMLRLK